MGGSVKAWGRRHGHAPRHLIRPATTGLVVGLLIASCSSSPTGTAAAKSRSTASRSAWVVGPGQGCPGPTKPPPPPTPHQAASTWLDRYPLSLELQAPGDPTGAISDPAQSWARLDPWPGDRPEMVLAIISAGMPDGWTPAVDQGVDPVHYRWQVTRRLAWFAVVHDVASRGSDGGCTLGAQLAAVDATTGTLLMGGGPGARALDSWITRQPPLGSGWAYKSLPTTTTTPAPPPPTGSPAP